MLLFNAQLAKHHSVRLSRPMEVAGVEKTSCQQGHENQAWVDRNPSFGNWCGPMAKAVRCHRLSLHSPDLI